MKDKFKENSKIFEKQGSKDTKKRVKENIYKFEKIKMPRIMFYIELISRFYS